MSSLLQYQNYNPNDKQLTQSMKSLIKPQQLVFKVYWNKSIILIAMDYSSFIQKIKTEMSEGEAEGRDRRGEAGNSTFKGRMQGQAKGRMQEQTKEFCGKCERRRVSCPSEKGKAVFVSGVERRNYDRLDSVKESRRQRSVSVPRITFSYDQQQQNIPRQRSNSFSIPQSINWVLTKVTTTPPLPLEQVIYYPVVHNKLIYLSPEGRKGKSEQEKASRRRSKHFYLSHSRNLMKDSHSGSTRQPMTPQQFKKMSEWTLHEK